MIQQYYIRSINRYRAALLAHCPLLLALLLLLLLLLPPPLPLLPAACCLLLLSIAPWLPPPPASPDRARPPPSHRSFEFCIRACLRGGIAVVCRPAAQRGRH